MQSTTDTKHKTGDQESDWIDAIIDGVQFDTNTFEPGVPDELLEQKRWLTVRPGAKNPSAPWSDEDAPAECNTGDCPADRADDPRCGCDARFKWGYEPHYVTGREARLAAQTFDVEQLAYIFDEDSLNLFLDFDDVRCPETGKVHPAAQALLAVLGPTWVEVSRSGTGLHAVYRGELPDDTVAKEPVLDLDDESWGSIEDSIPQVEIYPTKHNMVCTEMRVPGAPCTVGEMDGSAFCAVLDAHDARNAQHTGTGSDVSVLLADDDEDASDDSQHTAGDVTTDPKDVSRAVEQLDARRVAAKTIVKEWTDAAGADRRAFLPSWGSRSDGGTANYVDEELWHDTGTDPAPGCGYGGPVVMAAIDLGIVRSERAKPGCVSGSDWWDCIDHLREKEFSIPEYVDDSTDPYLEHVAAYTAGDADPYQDQDTCLLACLAARDDGAVPADAEPLTLALHAIVEHVWGVAADSHAADGTNIDMAREAFGEIDVETACGEFDLDAAQHLAAPYTGGDADE